MMIERVLELVQNGDSLLAIELVAREAEPAKAVEIYQEVANQLYWEAKNIQAAINMARAGIQAGLTAAALAADAARAYELRSLAKGLAYNLASYTWPGWDEDGIMLSAREVDHGLEAARLNLHLGEELEKGALPLSRAHWMLGAQQMAAGLLEPAAESFGAAERFGIEAEAREEALLAAGFAALAQLLANLGDAVATQQLADVKRGMAPFENGAMFIDQIETAQAVFEGAWGDSA